MVTQQSSFFSSLDLNLISEGRSSGEAYIELESEEDIARVLKMDKSVFIENRYIEVFKATPEEMDYVLEKAERQANQVRFDFLRQFSTNFKISPGTM